MVSILNPFVNYLHDAYALLNLAVNQHAFTRDNATFLGRSSAIHAIGAVHAAAHTCLQSIGRADEAPAMTLEQKFGVYLREKKERALDDVECALLRELEHIGSLLCAPQSAESYDYWRPSDDRVTDFARTPLKKIPHNITHWQPEYAGAVLGMAVSVLKRLLVVRCGHCANELEQLFGMQLQTASRHAVGFDEQLLDALRAEQEVLLANSAFMERMRSTRWKLRNADFQIDLTTAGQRPTCAGCRKSMKAAG